jgi:hypothetical protein
VLVCQSCWQRGDGGHDALLAAPAWSEGRQGARPYPPRIPVETDAVADHLLTTFEGAFVLPKLMGEPKLAAEQLIQCRNYFELLSAPATG